LLAASPGEPTYVAAAKILLLLAAVFPVVAGVDAIFLPNK